MGDDDIGGLIECYGVCCDSDEMVIGLKVLVSLWGKMVRWLWRLWVVMFG